MPAVDSFGSQSSSIDSPVRKAAAVTPHDTNELAFVSRSLYVGGAGDVAVLMADDSSSVTFVGCLAGQILPIRVKKVLATGTTATNLLALT